MFFKKQNIKDFHIPIRYWDEEKEKQESRERRIKLEMGKLQDKNYVLPDLQGVFKRKNNRYRKMLEKQRKRSILRLIIIILVLFMLIYIYFGDNFLNQIFQ